MLRRKEHRVRGARIRKGLDWPLAFSQVLGTDAPGATQDHRGLAPVGAGESLSLPLDPGARLPVALPLRAAGVTKRSTLPLPGDRGPSPPLHLKIGPL